jgi:ATP-dependent DNA helicase RecG
MTEKLKQLIQDGEGLTVEFKSCKNFSNRYGGYIILGVNYNGSICGLNPSAKLKSILLINFF